MSDRIIKTFFNQLTSASPTTFVDEVKLGKKLVLMVQTVKAQTIDLRYPIENFGLQRIRDDQFFWEWQVELPKLTDIEKQECDRAIDNRGNELYSVLKILKHLSQLAG